MTKYQLEVVAEKGNLQKRLGLTPIDRTPTSMFPKGKMTIRTTRTPSPQDKGGYALYYRAPDGHRAVCHVSEAYSWTANGRQGNGEIYYHFNSGCIKSRDFAAFINTLVAIENNVDRVMRRGETLEPSVDLS